MVFFLTIFIFSLFSRRIRFVDCDRTSNANRETALYIVWSPPSRLRLRRFSVQPINDAKTNPSPVVVNKTKKNRPVTTMVFCRKFSTAVALGDMARTCGHSRPTEEHERGATNKKKFMYQSRKIHFFLLSSRHRVGFVGNKSVRLHSPRKCIFEETLSYDHGVVFPEAKTVNSGWGLRQRKCATQKPDYPHFVLIFRIPPETQYKYNSIRNFIGHL